MASVVAREVADGKTEVSVLLPHRLYKRFWHRLLHDNTSDEISNAVSKLEHNGWIRRIPCPNDRRSTLAQLTDAGYHALVAAAPGHVQAVRRHVFDRLTPEQVDQLREIFSVVLAGLTAEAPGSCAAAVLAPAE